MRIYKQKGETMDDLISRQAAIDALMEILDRPNHADFLYVDEICRALDALQSEQPEIIYCKDCKKHNIEMGDHLDLGYNKYHWYEKSEVCPLIDMRGKAQGHEFDYQFCVYAERRNNE